MVKHIVMYKLKEPTEQNKQALKNKFLSMKGKIDLLVDIQSGVDVVKSQRSFDVVLECVFNSMEDLDKYRVHPVHVPVMEYVQKKKKKSHSVDYEY